MTSGIDYALFELKKFFGFYLYISIYHKYSSGKFVLIYYHSKMEYKM